jgi:hypothetical protein
MRTRRCLVVIDDPQTQLEASALAVLCGPGSHVLVTTRELRGNAYAMPSMSQAEGRAILDGGVADPCPQDVFDTVWATVGGHPLSLALMNGEVRDGTPWRDIQDDCAAVGRLPDSTQRLADRLLLRRQDLLRDPLAVFEWAGQPDCDAGFMRFVLQPAGLRTLQTHALTAADRDAVVRLHDVVFSSLSSLDWWTPSAHAQLCDKLETYLDAASRANDLSLWSAAGSLRSWQQAGMDGEPSSQAIETRRATLDDRAGALAAHLEEANALSRSYEAFLAQNELRALRASMDKQGGEGAADNPVPLAQQLQQRLRAARAALQLTTAARDAVVAYGDQLKAEAESFSTQFLLPLNDLIDAFNRALLSTPGETVQFNAEHTVERTALAMQLRYADAIDNAQYKTTLPPQLVLSEGQMAPFSDLP